MNFIKENDETMKLKNEEYMYQGFGLMMSEQQEQRRIFDEQNKESNEANINHHAIMMLKFEENEDNLNRNTSTINQSLNLNEEKIEHKIETKAIEILTNIEKVEDRILLESEKTIKTIIQEEEMTRKVIIQSDGQVFANVLNLKNQLNVLDDALKIANENNEIEERRIYVSRIGVSDV
jgi:hypothetical protein